MRRLEKMPTPQGIGANQTATVSLPLGPTYNTLFIRAKTSAGVNIATASWGNYVGEIRLMVNGNTRIKIDAADLVKLNQFYGQSLDAGVLPLHLSQPWTRTWEGEENTAYGTVSGIASFTLEIDLLDATSGFSIYALQSDPKPFGPHLTIQRFSDQMGLQGTKEIADLPRDAYNMLALHFDTDAVDKVEVLTNNLKVHESDKVLRGYHQKIVGRVPQAGMTHVDFMTENRLANVLPMALNDFRVKMDFTADDVNFKIYAMSIQGVAA